MFKSYTPLFLVKYFVFYMLQVYVFKAKRLFGFPFVGFCGICVNLKQSQGELGMFLSCLEHAFGYNMIFYLLHVQKPNYKYQL